jgi:hypothetical protein
MAATSASGKTIAVNDQVSVSGEVSAVSGSGQTAVVTVRVANGTTFTVQAGDCFAVQGIGVAISENGKPFGVGSQVTVKGSVTATSGSGGTATLTVTTKSNTTVSAVPAANAHAPHAH